MTLTPLGGSFAFPLGVTTTLSDFVLRRISDVSTAGDYARQYLIGITFHVLEHLLSVVVFVGQFQNYQTLSKAHVILSPKICEQKPSPRPLDRPKGTGDRVSQGYDFTVFPYRPGIRHAIRSHRHRASSPRIWAGGCPLMTPHTGALSTYTHTG